MDEIEFPPESRLLLKQAAESGKLAWVKIRQPYRGQHCPNCNDGPIKIQIQVGGSYDHYPSTQQRDMEVAVDPAGNYYRVKNYYFPCHVCGSNAAYIDLLLERSGLALNERDWRLSFFDRQSEGKEFALEFARNLLAQAPSPKGLGFLYGDYGVGKSGILKCLTAAFCRAGVPARYIVAEEFLGLLRSSYNREADISEDRISQEFTAYRFLAIDEVDPNHLSNSQWAMTQLMLILNARYDQRFFVATVMASNSTPETVWPYLASRLLDAERVQMGGSVVRGLDPLLTNHDLRQNDWTDI